MIFADDPLTPEEQKLYAQLLERMQRAGWIDKVMWTTEAIKPQFTQLGRQRFRELYHAIKELQCQGMGPVTLTELAHIIRLTVFDTERDLPPDNPR